MYFPHLHLVLYKPGKLFENVEHFVPVFHSIQMVLDVLDPVFVSSGALTVHKVERFEVRPRRAIEESLALL